MNLPESAMTAPALIAISKRGMALQEHRLDLRPEGSENQAVFFGVEFGGVDPGDFLQFGD